MVLLPRKDSKHVIRKGVGERRSGKGSGVVNIDSRPLFDSLSIPLFCQERTDRWPNHSLGPALLDAPRSRQVIPATVLSVQMTKIQLRSASLVRNKDLERAVVGVTRSYGISCDFRDDDSLEPTYLDPPQDLVFALGAVPESLDPVLAIDTQPHAGRVPLGEALRAYGDK